MGWLREDRVYEKHPAISPEFLSQAYYSGRAVIVRERPADVLWVRPYDDDWAGLELAAKEGRVTL